MEREGRKGGNSAPLENRVMKSTRPVWTKDGWVIPYIDELMRKRSKNPTTEALKEEDQELVDLLKQS